MALFKPYKITSDKLEDLAIQEGQIVITTDTKKLYVDVSATERIEITADVEVDLTNYVTQQVLTAALEEEATERQQQDTALENAIDEKIGQDNILAGDNINLSKDGINNVTISADSYYAGNGIQEDGHTFSLKIQDTNLNAYVGQDTEGFILMPHSTTEDGLYGHSIPYDSNIFTGGSSNCFTIKDGGIPAEKLADGVIPEIEDVTLASLGVTATAEELNYMDGVTSNVQTQLNGKAASSHTHSNATTTAAGFLPKLGGGTTNYLRADGTWAKPPDTNTTYSDMKGATSSAAGTHGLVPAPAAGAATRYLRSDGTWQVPPDTNTTYTLSSFGITATASELNHLDGITATVTELNYVDGVTSNIQTQLNGKAATSHTHSYLPLSGGTLTGTLNSRAIAPTATNTYSLGTSSLKYNAVYATTFYGSLSGNASSATKLGSSTVGSGVKPIYLNEGAAIASSSTVGSATRPVYLNNGAITQGTYTLGAACAKGVDTSISTGSTSTNLPTSKAVADLVASSSGGQEIAIQSTEPTDSNIKLWIKI